MKHIRQATELDKEAINGFGIREFQRSTEFSLAKPELPLWSRCDDENIVLAAWGKRCIVATMRAVLVCNVEQAQHCLQCSVAGEVKYPALIINSAATQLGIASHRFKSGSAVLFPPGRSPKPYPNHYRAHLSRSAAHRAHGSVGVSIRST